MLYKCNYFLLQVLKKEFPKGVDIVYESVGGKMFDLCLNALSIFGRLVVVGMISQVCKFTSLSLYSILGFFNLLAAWILVVTCNHGKILFKILPRSVWVKCADEFGMIMVNQFVSYFILIFVINNMTPPYVSILLPLIEWV